MTSSLLVYCAVRRFKYVFPLSRLVSAFSLSSFSCSRVLLCDILTAKQGRSSVGEGFVAGKGRRVFHFCLFSLACVHGGRMRGGEGMLVLVRCRRLD